MRGGRTLWGAILVAVTFASGLSAQHDADAVRREKEARAARASRLEQGLERLGFLVGDWHADVLGHAGGDELKPVAAVDFDVQWILNRKALSASLMISGYGYLLHVSYDADLDRYRITSMDDVSGLLDVYEGTFDANGILVVSNVPTGTSYTSYGKTWHNRMRFARTAGGFDWMIDRSSDDGATWQPQTVGHVRGRSASEGR